MTDDELSLGETTPVPGDGFRYKLIEPADDPEWNIELLAATDGVIAECLGTLSSDWQPLCADDLSSDEYYINERLTAAGLTERRLTVDARMRAGEPVQVTCIASGDYLHRLPHRIACEVPGWSDERGDAVGFVCLDIDRRQEVRLTGQGAVAQQDLRSGSPLLTGHVAAFVRGFTPFHGGHTAEGVVQVVPRCDSSQTDAASGNGDAPRVASHGQQPATVNARMIDVLARKPEARDWTAQKFATHLNCGAGTVKGCPAWKALMTERAGVKLNMASENTGKRRNNRRYYHN